MTFANLTDVSSRLGRPIASAAEVEQVNAWLADVEALILARIPDLVDNVADGSPSEAVVVMVEANAVIRKIRNPDGKVSEDVDDYRYRYGENAARGELFLTPDEWAQLEPGSGEGAFTIRPHGAPGHARGWVSTTEWAPL